MINVFSKIFIFSKSCLSVSQRKEKERERKREKERERDREREREREISFCLRYCTISDGSKTLQSLIEGSYLLVFISIFVKFALTLRYKFREASTRLSLREKCPYSELFWSIFSPIPTKYGDILRISPYSVRMRENTNNFEYGYFFSFCFNRWYQINVRHYLVTLQKFRFYIN